MTTTRRPSSTNSIQNNLINVPPTRPGRSQHSREFLERSHRDVGSDAAEDQVTEILKSLPRTNNSDEAVSAARYKDIYINIEEEEEILLDPLSQAVGAGVSPSGMPTPLLSSPTNSARLFENENNWDWLKRISNKYFFSPFASSIQRGWQFAKENPAWLVLAFLTTLPGGVNAFCMAANTDPKDFLKTINSIPYDTLMFATFNAMCSIGVNWDMNARFLPDAWIKLKNSMRAFLKSCGQRMSNSLALGIGVAALISAFSIAYDAWSFLPLGLVTALLPAILNATFNFATRYLGAFNIFDMVAGIVDKKQQMTKKCIEKLQSLKQEYINKLEEKFVADDGIDKNEINESIINNIFLTLNKWTESPIMCEVDKYLLAQFLSQNNIALLQNTIEEILSDYEEQEKCTDINAQIRNYITRQQENNNNQTPDYNQLLCIVYYNTNNDLILDQIRAFLLQHAVQDKLTTTNIQPFIAKINEIIANENMSLPDAEKIPSIKQALNQFITENCCADRTLTEDTLLELFAKIDELTRRSVCRSKTWLDYSKSFLITLFDFAVGSACAASIGLLFDAKGSAGANIMSGHREQDLPTYARIMIGLFPALANAIFYVDHVVGFSDVMRKTFNYLTKNPQYWINCLFMTGATLFSASSMQNIMYSILAHHGKDRPLNSTNFFDVAPDSPLGQALIWSVAAFAFMVNWKVLANNYYAKHITEGAPLQEYAAHYLNTHPLTKEQTKAYSNYVIFNHQKATRKPEPEQSPNPGSPLTIPSGP